MTASQVLVAGRYRLVRSLGHGGMGRVWLARDEVLHRDVAVKEVVLPTGLTEAELEELRLRTLREARAAARLSHPNVVQIYDVLRADDQPWIVMEYVPSRPLHRVITEEGPLAPERAARIGLSLLAALGAAHRVGVLHRDVKPSNVLISDTGRVVLTDFGLATFDGGENAVTRPGLVLGSPQYIAPERARDGDSTPESDLWSLGATLYAAVEGRSPFARSTAMATLTALAIERPHPMRRAGPLKPVLLGLLDKNARSRLGLAKTEELLRRVADPDTRDWRRLPGPRLPLEAPVGEPAVPRPPGAEPPTDAARSMPQVTTPLVEPRRRRRAGWMVAGVAAAVIVGLGLLAPSDAPNRAGSRPTGTAPPGTTRPGQPLPGGTRSGPPSAPAPVDGAGSPSAAPRASGPSVLDGYALPDGWVWHRDPSGFRIAVPMLWIYTIDGSLAYLQEPGGDRLLAVGAWKPSAADPLSALTREAADTATLPGYQRMRLERVACPFPACAEWEYAYDGANGVRLQAVSRGLRTATGQAWVIKWRTRAFDWQVNQSYFQLITASFRATS